MRLTVERLPTKRPGPGYYCLYEKSTKDDTWWLSEIKASLEYPWGRFLTISDPIQPSPTPKAHDIAEPPERILTTSYRILRDTELARRVKELHQYKCQVCCERIELREGYYAEVHHIKPLGEPHNGSDVMGNIICVCPNCHAKLDFGVIPLEANKLVQVGHHVVDQQYIDYHNQKIYDRDAEGG